VARVVVDVHLKSEILDPQGRAVQGALGRLGLDGVTNVRQGKQFIIDIDGYHTYCSRLCCTRFYLVLFVEVTVTDLDLVGDMDLDKDLV
jgi:hypothetical protein